MSIDTDPAEDAARTWARLTDKQRACLDLLLEHKTSKEIARLLDISKHTADQRLVAARDILGAASRAETAVFYARLKSIYDRMTYDTVEVPPVPVLVRSDFPDGSPPNLMELHEGALLSGGPSGERSPFRDIWRPDHDNAWRIAIIVTLLVAMVILLLGGLGIAQALKQLIAN